MDFDPNVMNVGKYFNAVSKQINVMTKDGIIQDVEIHPSKVWYSGSESKPLLYFVMFYVFKEDTPNPIPHCELIVDPEYLPTGVTIDICRFIVKDELIGKQVYKVFDFVEVGDRLHILNTMKKDVEQKLNLVIDNIHECVTRIMPEIVSNEEFTTALKEMRTNYIELTKQKDLLLSEFTKIVSEIEEISDSEF
jgi:hypothetical protein